MLRSQAFHEQRVSSESSAESFPKPALKEGGNVDFQENPSGEKTAKEFKDQAGIFFLQAEFFGAPPAHSSSNPSCAWRLKGGEATFNSDLKERVILEQEERVWEEVVMVQVERSSEWEKHPVGWSLITRPCWVPTVVGS